MTNKETLLRNIPIEELREGVDICLSNGVLVEYIAGPDANGSVVLKDADTFFFAHHTFLYKKPLHVLDDVPVYAGDTVWCRGIGHYYAICVTGVSGNLVVGVITECDFQSAIGDIVTRNWDVVTTTKPKTKTWINVYATGVEHFTSEAAASENAKDGLLICIEVEL